MRKDIIDIFLKKYENQTEITRNELESFLRNFYPNMRESSFSWYLYDLKNSGLITKLTNSNYKINNIKIKKKYKIKITNIDVCDALSEFNKSLMNETSYRDLNDRQTLFISMWESQILNEFSTHQVFSNRIIIELNKYRIEPLFYYLKEQLTGWYITMDYKSEQYQLSSEQNIIILLPLVNRAPLEKENLDNNNYVTVPRIEKILVDIAHEKKLFNEYDIYGLKEIYSKVYEKYNIDFTTLLYYARNRGKKEEIEELIKQTMGADFI